MSNHADRIPVPKMAELEQMDTETLVTLRIAMTASMNDVDIQLNDYSGRLRTGDGFPDLDWERRARHALGRYRQGLASIKNIISLRNRQTIAAQGGTTSPNRERRRLQGDLFDACERLIAADARDVWPHADPDGFDEAFEAMATAWRAVRDARAEAQVAS